MLYICKSHQTRLDRNPPVKKLLQRGFGATGTKKATPSGEGAAVFQGQNRSQTGDQYR